MIRKKIVPVLLSVLLLLTVMAPAGLTFAADSVTVTFLYAEDDTIRPFFDLTVSDGTAEAYGFAGAESDHAGNAVNTVSALDVLVAAHAAAYGDDFTAQTAGDYLIIDWGYASKAFGKTASFSFVVNDAMPHDDKLVTSEWGAYYTGYALDTTRMQNGDVMMLFKYADSAAYGDLYPVFGEKSLNVKANESVTLSATGYAIMPYGCCAQSVIDENTMPMTGAQVCLTQDFKTFYPQGTLDANGQLTLTVTQSGTWYAVIHGKVNNVPVVPNICTIRVSEADPQPDTPVRWFPIGLRPVLQFDSAINTDGGASTLRMGFAVRLRDMTGNHPDSTRTFALQIRSSTKLFEVRFICETD